MIVIFGSSSDIGLRLTEKLRAADVPCRTISRRMAGAVPADLETGDGVEAAISGATVVVSCAHARFTRALLATAPPDAKIVLTGSAWRYSHVPNDRADQVREAESLFLTSRFRGLMLHPAMIYGGNQENNIRRLLRVIRLLPVIPAPGGGHQIVCPIYVDDLVECLFAAVMRKWDGARAIGVAGPPLTWRQMVEFSANAIGLRRKVIAVPSAPFVMVLEAFKRLGFNLVDPNVVRRFGEDVDISLGDMVELLSVTPRAFSNGILTAVENWQQSVER
jgi:nucleoside-diphosphate-sugar epimerase